MLFHSITTFGCALSIVAHAAASPTNRDVGVLVDNALNSATVNVLDQRDDLIVRVDVDAKDVLDNVSRKRDNGSLVNIDIDLDNMLNNVSLTVLSR